MKLKEYLEVMRIGDEVEIYLEGIGKPFLWHLCVVVNKTQDMLIVNVLDNKGQGFDFDWNTIRALLFSNTVVDLIVTGRNYRDLAIKTDLERKNDKSSVVIPRESIRYNDEVIITEEGFYKGVIGVVKGQDIHSLEALRHLHYLVSLPNGHIAVVHSVKKK